MNPLGIADIVLQKGLEEYQRVDHVFDEDEMADLWKRHRYGEYTFRFAVCAGVVAQKAMTEYGEVAAGTRYFKDEINGFADRIHARVNTLASSKKYTRRLANTGIRSSSLNLKDLVEIIPLAFLPYAAPVMQFSVLPLLQKKFGTTPDFFRTLRACRDGTEKMYFAKIALMTSILPMVMSISDGIILTLANDLEMHTQVWWRDMCAELETVHLRALGRLQTCAVEAMQAGRADMEVAYRQFSVDDTEELHKGIQFDIGYLRFKNIMSLAAYPIDDAQLEEAAFVVDRYIGIFSGDFDE